MKAFWATAAALTLVGCSDLKEAAVHLSDKIDPAINESAAVEAAASAVDVDAAKLQAERVARTAIQEVLPADELAALAAIVDEKALAQGIDKATNAEDIRNVVRDTSAGRVASGAGSAE